MAVELSCSTGSHLYCVAAEVLGDESFMQLYREATRKESSLVDTTEGRLAGVLDGGVHFCGVRKDCTKRLTAGHAMNVSCIISEALHNIGSRQVSKLTHRLHTHARQHRRHMAPLRKERQSTFFCQYMYWQIMEEMGGLPRCHQYTPGSRPYCGLHAICTAHQTLHPSLLHLGG